MQRNLGKFHLILNTNESKQIQIGESLIERANCEKAIAVCIIPFG